MKKLFLFFSFVAIAASVEAQQTPREEASRITQLETTTRVQDSIIRSLETQVKVLKQQSIQTTYGKRMEIDRRTKQPVYR